MKINVSYPQTGCQKLFEIEDEKKVRPFYEKRLGHEMEADGLGDEWKGYIIRIAGGNDKQGFPMKQGVLTNNRVRLLLAKGHSCYRQRRTGERKRKSVRGCIVDSNLSVLALVILKKGDNDIPGLTDVSIPRKLGPKRASKIRKLFNLEKEDDVRRFVIRRPLSGKEGKKPTTVSPKIQRLITPIVLQHRRYRAALKRKRREKNKEGKMQYAKLLASKHQEEKSKRKEDVRRRRTSSMMSASSAEEKVEKKQKVEKKVVKAAPKGVKKITKEGAKPKPKPKTKDTVKKAGAVTAKVVAKATKAPTKPAPKTAAKPASKPAAKPASKPAAAKAAPKLATAKSAAKKTKAKK